jgi:hypothetical protein
MRGDYGIITLSCTAKGWMATFSGKAAETVVQAFGTDTLPTAFAAEAPAGKVMQAMASQWRGYVVVCGGRS